MANDARGPGARDARGLGAAGARGRPAAARGLLERLAAGEVLVGDGAIGSLLIDEGLSPGECPEAWNLTRPDLLETIAASYRDAGADFIATNTFGGSPLKLAAYGLEGKTEEINRRAVELARRGAGGRALVVASCGPSGRILEPYGDTDPGEVLESFARQMRVLAGAGVDAVCIETMTDLGEAVLAVRAAKSAAPSLPVMATMTFDRTSRGFFTIMGNTIAASAAALADAGADVVGSNCGNGIENMIDIAREMRAASRLRILIQSNAGLPEIRGDRAVYPETPSFMAEKARELLAIGVSIVGGCCGTTPEHIAALRAVVDRSAARN